MFLNNQSKSQVNTYVDLLQRVGSLSGLFSNSSVPYLHYRLAENIFCRAFEAENHSRSDTSADASKQSVGIGLKTFINSKGQSWQKVAEFNKERKNYIELQDNPNELIAHLSRLRNKRIDFAKSAHNLDKMFYHCVTRSKGMFFIFEETMQYLDENQIKIKTIKPNTIQFSDGHDEYIFNLSKSTLLKQFTTKNEIAFEVKIVDDPFEFLQSLKELAPSNGLQKVQETIILPLYSYTSDQKKYVPEKSGINQWNAGGRTRNQMEVYIPIPSWIHKEYAGFFPPRSESFNLKLPNGTILSAGVFQDGGKALMSNPNKALGDWLINKVLKIPLGKIVTYDDLDDLGVDSVEVQKIDDQNYEIDFKRVGSFEQFAQQSNQGG